MYIHKKSVYDKCFDAWISKDRFTKNPDIIRLDSGRLVLVYCDNDQHWSMEDQIITLLASDDEGKSWSKLVEVDKADLSSGDERLVTPRISLLKDGRLAIIVDHNDFGHFHENQSPGNWIYFSSDEGLTWEGPLKNEIEGFEPDRIIDLPDGRLAVATHLMLADSQEFAVVMSCSSDGGYTWQRESIIAHDGVHRFCEGGLVLYENETKLLCVVRENHSAGIPSFVAFSPDMGKTWSGPKRTPFSFHRPYAKELSNGKIMVTGRNVNGGLGTYAWVGDLAKETGAVVGGPRTQYNAVLTDEALVIENSPKDEARYCLLPPESAMSTVFFEAELKIESDTDEAVAAISVSRIGADKKIYMAKNWIEIPTGDLIVPMVKIPMDFSDYHKISIGCHKGLIELQIDSFTFLTAPLYHDNTYCPEDFYSRDFSLRTQFGQYGSTGKSYWKSITYKTENQNTENYDWGWRAESGEYPDQYQLDRHTMIHPNTPHGKSAPDNGYSSWVELENGKIVFVDYTNLGDKPDKSHIVGAVFNIADLD